MHGLSNVPSDPDLAIDFEAEVAVIVDDVEMGISPQAARERIRLVMLCNDVSLRNLIPAELDKGFGFFQSKPASAARPITEFCALLCRISRVESAFGSQPTIITFLPISANAATRFWVVVDLPIPPLP